MKEYAGINIPIRKVEIVPIKSTMDAIDFMLDMECKDKFSMMRRFMNEKSQPFNININKTAFYKKQYYIYKPHYGIVLILHLPPKILWAYQDQQFIIFVAPDLKSLIEYFYKWKRRSFNPYEVIALHILIQALEYVEQTKADVHL